MNQKEKLRMMESQLKSTLPVVQKDALGRWSWAAWDEETKTVTMGVVSTEEEAHQKCEQFLKKLS